MIGRLPALWFRNSLTTLRIFSGRWTYLTTSMASCRSPPSFLCNKWLITALRKFVIVWNGKNQTTQRPDWLSLNMVCKSFFAVERTWNFPSIFSGYEGMPERGWHRDALIYIPTVNSLLDTKKHFFEEFIIKKNITKILKMAF